MTRAHKGWALDTVTIHNDVLRQTKEEIMAPPAVGVVGGAESEKKIHVQLKIVHEGQGS